MVRRSAASQFGSFAAAVEKEHQAQDMVNIYSSLAQDEQDSVRQLIVPGALSIGARLADASQSSLYVFPVVKNACNDRSWRVRNEVARSFPDIITALDASADFQDQMISCFLGLLQDTEAEVRGAAAGNIAKVVDIAGCDTFINDVAPLVEGLSKDPVMEVSFAEFCSRLDTTICKSIANTPLTPHTHLAPARRSAPSSAPPSCPAASPPSAPS